mmetsp:Transcript_20533/g.33815  ORF Transcript_20533/g.33815 Transcript_20533/m.33815 type:complete len:223 (+) Transcript_20533:589-1257(+)
MLMLLLLLLLSVTKELPTVVVYCSENDPFLSAGTGVEKTPDEFFSRTAEDGFPTEGEKYAFREVVGVLEEGSEGDGLIMGISCMVFAKVCATPLAEDLLSGAKTGSFSAMRGEKSGVGVVWGKMSRTVTSSACCAFCAAARMFLMKSIPVITLNIRTASGCESNLARLFVFSLSTLHTKSKRRNLISEASNNLRPAESDDCGPANPDRPKSMIFTIGTTSRS